MKESQMARAEKIAGWKNTDKSNWLSHQGVQYNSLQTSCQSIGLIFKI